MGSPPLADLITQGRDAAKRKARALLEEMAAGGPPVLGPAVLPGHAYVLANGSADTGKEDLLAPSAPLQIAAA